MALVGPAPPNRGGIPRYTSHLRRALAVRHEVDLFSYSRLYPGFLYPGRSEIDPSSVAGEGEPQRRLIDQTWPPTWLAAARAISTYNPDAVVMQWWTSFGAPCTGSLSRLLRRRGVPVLALCHNLVSHERRGVDALATRVGLGAMNGLLVQSEEDRERAATLLPGKRVWRIDHPVWDDLEGRRIPSERAKALVGVSGKALLFFGLVREHKGLADLLAALPRVLASTEVTLLVVGEFWEKRSIYDRLIVEYGLRGRVKILDRYVTDEEMAGFFCASDLVVLPYRSGTQSGVAVSAYAFERPIVATAVGGLPEVVEDGVTGRVVPPREPEALAAAIVDCLDSGAPGAFAEGIAAARKRLSWERLVSTIDEAVTELKERR